MTERIHPHPKNWRNGVSGEYETRSRKRGGSYLYFRGELIFIAPTAKVCRLFAHRHAAGEVKAEVYEASGFQRLPG